MTTTVETPGFKPKKSVALSGVTAGNTALCTVGRTGNDLHYRGYDILDIAEVCEFEEIAHLLVHGKLPTRAELRAYKSKLRALRGLPMSVKQALEQLPAASHPMDVMRTGVSALGCALPEKDDHNLPGARDIADRLMASLGSMLLYWHHWASSGRRIEVETDDDSIRAPPPPRPPASPRPAPPPPPARTRHIPLAPTGGGARGGQDDPAPMESSSV